jgi:ring-1,2-phenylacetyl-CoA epoxidase subunit PaaA
MTAQCETGSIRYEAFLAHLASGGKVEATDWMPEAYRAALLRFIEMHANSELMGVLPEREWIMRAPSLQRKLALTAKVQDEVGHAQLLYRLAEDLGKSRAQMMDDLLAGRTKFHNVFHYPTHTWGDVGVIAWLVDAAAILSQKALLGTSYAPYARIMQRICWEESFHIKHGYDIVVTLAGGTCAQRTMLQEALNRWWPPLMQMHGPPTPPDRDKDLTLWRIKTRDNESLRQEFIATYVPRVWQLGLRLPDAALGQNPDGSWSYTEPDWDELRRVVSNHGPCSAERLAFRRLNYEQGAWVRGDAVD